ncbi:MAG TPA: ATP-binding protein, partial [Acidimicrobiales bacterium]|nr:ATP-binding protein [Acidimicrobiales bacterium]
MRDGMAMATDRPAGVPGQVQDRSVVSRARADVVRRADDLGLAELADDAALVVSELVTNALLHGGGCAGVATVPIDSGIRIEVRDRSSLPPMLGRPSEESLTGRGLRLVANVSARWGADTEPGGGKVVWAEITTEARTAATGDADDLLAMWADDWDPADDGVRRFHLQLGDVPTDLLLAAKSHVDNVVREFTLAAAGARAGQTADVPPHLRQLLGAVVDRFAEARLAIKRQALAAAERGDERTMLILDLPASAADAAEEYARALDKVDSYSRAKRLLTIETPPQHRVFRHWYIDELVRQLRALAAGEPAPPSQSFDRRLLAEIDRMAMARREAERAAKAAVTE